MKKHQLDHVLRAAGDITGEKRFVIVSSQALHGKYPNLADDIGFRPDRAPAPTYGLPIHAPDFT